VTEKNVKTKEILKGFLNVLRRIKKLRFEGDDNAMTLKSEKVFGELLKLLKEKASAQSPIQQMARQTVDLMESM
jgi:hypothetical protein